MAEFISFDDNVEVNGETVATIINSFPEYLTGIVIRILKEHGIDNPTSGQWYSQQLWLNAFKEISDKFGSNTLFEIGKALPSNAKFPSNIDSIEKALISIDEAYQINHRGGNIGFYKLVEFNEKLKSAVMHCNNPYPCEFDRGIITAMARKFRPVDSNFPEALLDKSKPNRKNGADESWYIVSW
ncbi:MAG: hypothetical protein JEZ09_08495 [Salinivirgaceae bacterium]|nr:hypothetical protein [Salinivirgaceae bacterium]